MRNFFLLLTIGFLAAGCKDKNKDYIVTIHTKFGDMKVLLYKETPLHKQNFLELAREGRYDSTTWHRVIENFMIQGGDVYSKEGIQEKESDRIPPEIVEGFYHTRGALAAARQGDQANPERMSSASQFYIVHGKKFSEQELTINQYALNQALSQLMKNPDYDSIRQKFVELQQQEKYEEMNQLAFEYADLVEEVTDTDVTRDVDPEVVDRYTTTPGAPHLDGAYTVFGKVVEGMDVINQIAAVRTGRTDKPVQPIYLTMDVEQVPKKEIEKKYDYKYPDSK